ncbi:MAG: hypothetical protein ABEJ64_02860 [Candidatus Nanohaloarchaea archaeon]
MTEEEVRNRVIEPVSIEVEERSGHEVLVVEDSAGNRYTTLRDDLVREVPANRDKYIGRTWKIKWSLTDEGFVNFHGFVEEVDGEPDETKIDDSRPLSETDVRITRQSAGHDAARIVSGRLASGERLGDEDIARELRKWTDYLKEYYRTGEWRQ